MQSVQGHLRRAPQAEQGQDARGLPGKFDGLLRQDRGDIVPAHKPAPGAVGGQIPQGLEIGNGMVQPGTVHGPVKQEAAAPVLQPHPDRQHGIGIVLFHRVDPGTVRNIAQGVEIPQNDVRAQAQSLGMPQTAVGGDDQRILRNGRKKPIKPGSAENNAGFHKTTRLLNDKLQIINDAYRFNTARPTECTRKRSVILSDRRKSQIFGGSRRVFAPI